MSASNRPKFIKVFNYDSKQTVLVNIDHIVKVSDESNVHNHDKFKSYINTLDKGTIRVMLSYEEVYVLIEEAINA